ncbi:uncharacterized protein LOC118439395 [Folsomia candida]|nr:uncharacterized protein LOC118439395 [Folsomia candida]
MVNAMTSFPRLLNFLVVRIYQRDVRTVTKVGQMLRRHSTSLKLFELVWHTQKERDFISQKIDLPRYFPQLESLRLKVAIHTGPEEIERFALDMVDVFYFRPLFLENGLKISMPRLTQLQIVVSYSVNPDFWVYLIPDCDQNGSAFEIPQIKILSTSLVTENCGSVQVTRFSRTFPNLTMFQHVIKIGDQFHGCNHKIRKGRLVKTEKSVENIGLEYPDYIDIQLRSILQISGEPEGFLWV